MLPSSPKVVDEFRDKAIAGYRQVFGLAGGPLDLFAVASQLSREGQCCDTAFVPAHRCGAVPDLHRVPFFMSSLPELGQPLAQSD